MDTPTYIKALLVKNGRKAPGRKVWSVDLETVWLPFFTATNVQGDAAIPADVLGAPLRLAYDADGSVKFSKTGRPVFKVAQELQAQVKLIRENFTIGLISYAEAVIRDRPDDFKAQVEAAQEAAEPIIAKDRAALDAALVKAVEDAVAQAQEREPVAA